MEKNYIKQYSIITIFIIALLFFFCQAISTVTSSSGQLLKDDKRQK